MPRALLALLVTVVVILAIHPAIATAGIASSPEKTNVCVWEPCAFEFGRVLETALLSRVVDQGYPYVYRFVDATDDDSVDGCTRDDWDTLDAECGIMLVDSHGGPCDMSGFVCAAYSRDESVLLQWADKDSDGQTDAYMFVGESIDVPGVFCVGVKYMWFVNNWTTLTYNSAIVFMAFCDSARGTAYDLGIIDNVGGNAKFGYKASPTTGDILLDICRLFNRMNGVWNAGGMRKAGAAFDGGDFSQSFAISGDPDTTLCPSCVDLFPGRNGTTSSTSGIAYINLDTFCYNMIPASQALTATVSPPGACNLKDFAWSPCQYSEDPLQRCRQVKFVYEYAGDPCHVAFTITATAHADKIQAWAFGRQQMDGDRVKPNGDDVTWTFSYQAP